jgi:hypothetical protein
MTADQFRNLALALPEATEREHQGHPDFRVGDKIFATLGPEEAWGMLRLTPIQQAACIDADPGVFEPFNGEWGRRGATRIRLEAAHESIVRPGLVAAWRNVAPKRLAQQWPDP